MTDPEILTDKENKEEQLFWKVFVTLCNWIIVFGICYILGFIFERVVWEFILNVDFKCWFDMGSSYSCQ